MQMLPELAREIWEFVGHRHAEIRVKLPDGRAFSRFVNNPEELHKILNEFNGKALLWIGINERRKGGTKNEDVIMLRNAVLDLEHKEKPDQYPTDAQRQACLAVVNQIRKWCRDKGINTLVVDSGRGFHVWVFLKPIEVNDANRLEIATKYKRFYDLIREQFETSEVKIDTTSDLARVIGIPYTVNVKWGKERKPGCRLERLPGDKATEVLLSLKPPEPRVPISELVDKSEFSRDRLELPPCVALARECGVPTGCRDNFFYALLNALDWKFKLSEGDALALIAPIAKRSNFSLGEAKGKVCYHVGKGKHYEPRTLCKYAKEAKLCENPHECYWFARLTRVSDLRAELIGEQVIVEGQIVGERSQMAIPKTIIAECSNCAVSESIDVAKDAKTLHGYVLGGHEPKKEIERLFRLTHGEKCADGKKLSFRDFERDHMDYAVLWVRDPLEKLGLERFDKRTHEPREVHLVGQTVPHAKKVRVWGKVALDKKRNITIVANRIKPLESEVASFTITEEDKQAWVEHFANGGAIHKEIAPHIVGEKREIAKKMISLVYHSPPVIPNIHGRVIRGTITVAEFGDTTAGKSQTAKDLTDGSEGGWEMPLGVYVLAETGGRTGLLYTIDNDRHMLIWGELVLNDLGLVVVDGLEQISPEEFGEFREAIRTGKISVRRALVGDAWTRTRLITCFNPKKPMNQYLYPCEAIANTWTFENPTNITRWDIFVPFALDDVPPEEIADGKTEERPIPPEVFARHVWWVWSRGPENIIYEREAMEEIKNVDKELIGNYSTQSLPIISNETFATVCRFAVARAAERHSTDEAHEKIIVKPEHVRSVMDDFKQVLGLLKLGEYKLDEENKLKITDNEFAQICMDLDDKDWEVLDRIKHKGKSAPILAKELNVSEQTIKTHYGKLRGHGLIETKPGVGAEITPRAVMFLRLVQIKGKETSTPEKKREGQQKIYSCEKCGGDITVKPIHAADGTPLCEKCAENYGGRV